MTTQEAIDLIYSTEGRIFTVEFIKRSTQELRVMNCRLGVHKHLKGGSLAYDPAKHELITVWDLKADGYRMISIEGLTRIKINGEDWRSIEHQDMSR